MAKSGLRYTKNGQPLQKMSLQKHIKDNCKTIFLKRGSNKNKNFYRFLTFFIAKITINNDSQLFDLKQAISFLRIFLVQIRDCTGVHLLAEFLGSHPQQTYKLRQASGDSP